jgi:uncharacterized protein (DUF433 family)
MASDTFKTGGGEFRELGRFVVADPVVCGGKPTFKGTRVMLWQVLDQVAAGMPWEQISWSWRDKVSNAAIAEAVQLAASHFKEPVAPNVPPRRERLRTRSLATA